MQPIKIQKRKTGLVYSYIIVKACYFVIEGTDSLFNRFMHDLESLVNTRKASIVLSNTNVKSGVHHSYGNIVKELDLYLVICTIWHKQSNKEVGCQESQDLAFTEKSQ